MSSGISGQKERVEEVIAHCTQCTKEVRHDTGTMGKFLQKTDANMSPAVELDTGKKPISLSDQNYRYAYIYI